MSQDPSCLWDVFGRVCEGWQGPSPSEAASHRVWEVAAKRSETLNPENPKPENPKPPKPLSPQTPKGRHDGCGPGDGEPRRRDLGGSSLSATLGKLLAVPIRLLDKILHDLIYLNYGIYGTILYLGHAEFCPSTVWMGGARG